jgi:hypothetical protein
MSIVMVKIRNEITSKGFLVILRVAIKPRSSPARLNVATNHITINHIFIITNNLEIYIVSPHHGKTTSSIILSYITIHYKQIRKMMTKRIDFFPKIRILKFCFSEKNNIRMMVKDKLPEGSDCGSFTKASAVPREELNWSWLALVV